MATPKTTSAPQVAANLSSPFLKPMPPSVMQISSLAYLPLAGLFHPGEDNDWEDGNLPFTQDREDGRTSYWVEPLFDFPDKEEILAAQAEFGKRAAAVYFIHVMRNGSRDISLCSIIDDMPKPLSYAAQNFLHHTQRLLWLYGQHISAVQVANDVEARILEDRRLALL